jgi:hypothetical protein
MRALQDDGARDVLARLAARAGDLELPPGALPGWSSLCGTEYSLLIASLAAEVTALRAALDVAVRAAP